MQRNLILVVTVVIALCAIYYVFFVPSWIDPVAWSPDPDPGLTGAFAPNSALARVDQIARGVVGPEDIELGPDGWLYASLRDGRIVRFDPQSPDSFFTFVDTKGYPLGLEFDAAGNLIVADGDLGVLEVTPAGNIRVLIDAINGARMRFPDDLAIAHDGTIWFSDMYQSGPADLVYNAWEGKATGRVISFDRATKQAAVRMDGLMFANGVALGPNDECVVVTELFGARVARLWLTGPRRGTRDLLIGDLPGYPDNVTYDGAGTFWLALVAPRNASFERWSRYPFVRAFVAKAPLINPPHPMPSYRTHRYWAWVVGVGTTGVVKHNLQNPPGDYGAITSANAFDGQLYLGSVKMTSVGRFDLADLFSTP